VWDNVCLGQWVVPRHGGSRLASSENRSRTYVHLGTSRKFMRYVTPLPNNEKSKTIHFQCTCSFGESKYTYATARRCRHETVAERLPWKMMVLKTRITRASNQRASRGGHPVWRRTFSRASKRPRRVKLIQPRGVEDAATPSLPRG
jgi:hypothetical protein